VAVLELVKLELKLLELQEHQVKAMLEVLVVVDQQLIMVDVVEAEALLQWGQMEF
jgi:hypothetical protein